MTKRKHEQGEESFLDDEESKRERFRVRRVRRQKTIYVPCTRAPAHWDEQCRGPKEWMAVK